MDSALRAAVWLVALSASLALTLSGCDDGSSADTLYASAADASDASAADASYPPASDASAADASDASAPDAGVPPDAAQPPDACGQDERVADNACVACPDGTTNAAGDDPGGPDTTCDQRPVVQCTPDAALIAEARACRKDEHCPCGAHCVAGRCAAECATHGDCPDGTLCDAFGRCRAGDINQLIVARNDRGPGRPRVLQRALLSAGPDAPSLMTVVADNGAVERMRIVADEGAEVALPVEGVEPEALEYGPEVVIDARTEAGESVSVFARLAAPADQREKDSRGAEGSEGVTITVISESNRTSTASLFSAALGVVSPPAQPPPVAGVYEGFAQLTGSGLVDGAKLRSRPLARRISTKLTVEIFPPVDGRAVISLRDHLRLLIPGGEWVGELILDDAPRVTLPAMEQIPLVPVAGSQVQAVAVALGGALSSDPRSPDWTGRIGLDLELVTTGVMGPTSAPRQAWTLAFTRVGDLPDDGAPPSPADPAQLEIDLYEAVQTPLPREAAFLASVADRDGFGRSDVDDPTLRCSRDSMCAADEFCVDPALIGQCRKRETIPSAYLNAWRRDPALRAQTVNACTDPRDAVSEGEALDGPDGTLSLCAGNRACVLFEHFAHAALAGGARPFHTSINGFVTNTPPQDRRQAINVVGLMGAWAASASGGYFGGHPVVWTSDDEVLLDEFGRAPSYQEFKQRSVEDTRALNAPLLRGVVDALTITPSEGLALPNIVGLTVQLGDLSALEERPMWTLDDGTVLDFAVPCAFDLSGLEFPPVPVPEEGYGLTIDSASLDLDACAGVTQRFECAVVDLEGRVAEEDRAVFDSESGPFGAPVRRLAGVGVMLNVIDPEFGDGEPTTELRSLATGRTLVSKVCVFPTVPSACAEASLCDPAFNPYGDLTTNPLSLPANERSGDLGCAEGGLGLTQPMDLDERTVGALRADCITELGALDAAAPAAPAEGDILSRLDAIEWNDDAACLNPQRFLTQLALAGASARDVGRFERDRPISDADLIFARLLQRYLQTAQFIAGDAITGVVLEADAESTPEAGRGVEVLEAALDRSLDRWNLILIPRIGASLAGLSADALAAPDYRYRALAGPPPFAERSTQGVGLPATMMSLLATQMELMAKIAERRARSGGREVPASVARGFMLAGLVEAHVNALVERALSPAAETEVSWIPDFDAARSRFEGARLRALAQLRIIDEDGNPLGIDDEDLPLYFRELDNDAANYTAISQFILGTTGVNSGVAMNAVIRAREAFDAAAAARQAEASRRVDFANNEAILAEDIRAARRALGESVQDLCGASLYEDEADPEVIADLIEANPELAPPLGGRIDFGTCWFRGGLSECKVDQDLQQDLEQLQRANELLARDELVATVEANMRNSLCVATLAGSEIAIPADDPDVSQDVDFDLGHGIVRPFPAVLWSSGGTAAALAGAMGDEDARAFCSPPPGNGARMWAGSRALRQIQERLLDPDGPYRAELVKTPRTFILKRQADIGTCGSERTGTGSVSVIPHGRGAANECLTGDHAGPGGLFPEVRFEPGEGEGERPRRIITCRPVEAQRTPIEIEVTEAELAVDEYADRGRLAEATAFCQRLYPRQMVGLSTERQTFEVTSGFCYRGDLGAQAASLRSLVGEIVAAKSEAADLTDAYVIEKRSCFELQQGNAALSAAFESFEGEINTLRATKVAMDIAAVAANQTKDCLATMSGVVSSDPAADAGGGGLATASCAMAAVATVLEGASILVESEMEKAELAHDENMRSIEAATNLRQCFTEAELALVGQQSQAVRILLAMQEMEAGYAAMVNSIVQARSSVERGRAAIATARRSGNATVGADPFIGRALDRAEVSLRLARRATYLAVRAVEYEFQTSLPERGVVLRADHPDVLEGVIQTLRDLVNTTNGPNGRRPSELTEVFSLRQHLLQLGATAEGPSGELLLTEAERFRLALQDPRYEVYEDGEFKGREIPFVIAPLGALDLGEALGVPIVADDSCGERVWSVNVSVLGDPSRTYRGFAPQVNLQIRKSNTFFANWCDSGDTPFQVASTRPSRNLFREPGVAEGYSLQGADEVNGQGVARVQALLDIEPREFITDEYVDGASTELAGRLLFGAYSLYIPARSIARVDEAGEPISDGLVLSEVDDIAIRLDYLSVSRGD